MKLLKFRHLLNPPQTPRTIGYTPSPTKIIETILEEDNVTEAFLYGRGGVYFSQCDITQTSRKQLAIRKAVVINKWKWISNIHPKATLVPLKISFGIIHFR